MTGLIALVANGLFAIGKPTDTKKAPTVISWRGYGMLRLGGAAKYNEEVT
jgi:hypothetical protein